MKFALRVLAFSLCLVATYSAASFNRMTTPHATAPVPLCNPANPNCQVIP